MSEAVDKYHRLLAKAQKEKPSHPLLAVASKKFSLLAIKYLEKILFAKPPKVKQIEVEEDVSTFPKSIKQLLSDQRNLYSQRALLSNSFHSCNTDRQRAKVSRKIRVLQKQITANRKAVTEYYADETLPVSTQSPSFKELNIKQLFSKRNSLVSSISRWKKKVKELTSLDNSNVEKEKIPSVKAKIAKAQKQLDDVKKLIEDKAV